MNKTEKNMQEKTSGKRTPAQFTGVIKLNEQAVEQAQGGSVLHRAWPSKYTGSTF